MVGDEAVERAGVDVEVVLALLEEEVRDDLEKERGRQSSLGDLQNR